MLSDLYSHTAFWFSWDTGVIGDCTTTYSEYGLEELVPQGTSTPSTVTRTVLDILLVHSTTRTLRPHVLKRKSCRTVPYSTLSTSTIQSSRYLRNRKQCSAECAVRGGRRRSAVLSDRLDGLWRACC